MDIDKLTSPELEDMKSNPDTPPCVIEDEIIRLRLKATEEEKKNKEK